MSIFKKPRSSSKQGRNGFDMSFHRSFTAPCGMLLPVAKDFANPGDKYKLNSSLFIRTEALQSAAFQKFKVHVDWFFVPIEQIYSLWNEFYNSTNDVNSSIFNIGNSVTLPLFDLQDPADSPAFFSKNGSVWVDDFGVPQAHNFRRLWDMFEYGSVEYSGIRGIPLMLPLLDFLSYHRIYFSHYCPTDWFKNEPMYYNVDKFYNTNPDDSTMINILGTMRYRPWRKDLFTNIMPQPLFGDAFANALSSSITSSDNNRYLINKEGLYRDGRISYDLSSYGGSNDVNKSASVGIRPAGNPTALNSINQLTINTADIRAAFALDKLLRTSAFAGSHYDEQTLAHFGYQMPKGISKEVYFLGSQQTDVTIGEVVSTSSTGAMEDGKALAGSTIGDIAGKGFGSTSGQGDCEFTCPSHGYIMAIFSIEPLQTYASIGFSLFNRYSNTLDFYHEELDNIGMQPLLLSQLDSSYIDENEKLLGWQYRWSELKTKYDVVNESFWNTSRKTWVATKFQDEIDANGITRYHTDDKYFHFLISPTYTNSIFLSNFNSPTVATIQGQTKWTDSNFSAQRVYGNDPFLIDADFKIFKTSIMSTYSLPKF